MNRRPEQPAHRQGRARLHVVPGVSIAIIAIATFVAYFLLRPAARNERPGLPALPYQLIGDIGPADFPEPSDIVFHPGRGTLFVVSDEGPIIEMTTDGKILQRRQHGERDLEAAAVHPVTGLLYVAAEGSQRILELDPDSLDLLREMVIDPNLEGVARLRRGNEGIEGLAFAVTAAHPRGDALFAVNQAMSDDDPHVRSALLELSLPAPGSPRDATIQIVRYMPIDTIDLSALHFNQATGHFLAVSDTNDVLIVLDSETGAQLGEFGLPGVDQEGFTIDPDGFAYIAQDSGGILKIRADLSGL